MADDPFKWIFEQEGPLPDAPPKCRSKFPAALRRAAVAVDKAMERAKADPSRESEFEREKDRFLAVFRAMSEEKRKSLRYHALVINMEDVWEDKERSQGAWNETRALPPLPRRGTCPGHPPRPQARDLRTNKAF